ncbi:MAG TPA: hypothetical protein ACQGQX_06875 [Xylella taiwanensis]
MVLESCNSDLAVLKPAYDAFYTTRNQVELVRVSTAPSQRQASSIQSARTLKRYQHRLCISVTQPPNAYFNTPTELTNWTGIEIYLQLHTFPHA